MLAIDKDLNFAPVLRIFDLTNFLIKFDLELFNGFDRCIMQANQQFIVICLPKCTKSFIGFSFGHTEDAKQMFQVINQVVNIENLREVINSPSI
jgi:hypothetical protein